MFYWLWSRRNSAQQQRNKHLTTTSETRKSVWHHYDKMSEVSKVSFFQNSKVAGGIGIELPVQLKNTLKSLFHLWSERIDGIGEHVAHQDTPSVITTAQATKLWDNTSEPTQGESTFENISYVVRTRSPDSWIKRVWWCCKNILWLFCLWA